MIGLLDSDLGGLCVARAVIDRFPGCDLIYVADTARAPFGGKHPDTVSGFVRDAIRWLETMGARLILPVCHTSAAVMAGMTASLPLMDPIGFGAQSACAATRKRRIGLLAPASCLQTGAYQAAIERLCPEATVWSQDGSILIPLTEGGWLGRPAARMILKKCLHPLKMKQVDTLIPAFSHYPLFSKTLRDKAGKRIHVIDPILPMMDALNRYREDHPENQPCFAASGCHRFFATDIGPHTANMARRLFQGNITIQAFR